MFKRKNFREGFKNWKDSIKKEFDKLEMDVHKTYVESMARADAEKMKEAYDKMDKLSSELFLK
jgi:hypothetical protein